MLILPVRSEIVYAMDSRSPSRRAGGGRGGRREERQEADSAASQSVRMDRETLTMQIDNMKSQANMQRWPLSKSIEA